MFALSHPVLDEFLAKFSKLTYNNAFELDSDGELNDSILHRSLRQTYEKRAEDNGLAGQDNETRNFATVMFHYEKNGIDVYKPFSAVSGGGDPDVHAERLAWQEAFTWLQRQGDLKILETSIHTDRSPCPDGHYNTGDYSDKEACDDFFQPIITNGQYKKVPLGSVYLIYSVSQYGVTNEEESHQTLADYKRLPSDVNTELKNDLLRAGLLKRGLSPDGQPLARPQSARKLEIKTNEITRQEENHKTETEHEKATILARIENHPYSAVAKILRDGENVNEKNILAFLGRVKNSMEKLEKDIKEGKEVNIKEIVEQSINDIIENIPENSKIKSLCQSKQQELINEITKQEEKYKTEHEKATILARIENHPYSAVAKILRDGENVNEKNILAFLGRVKNSMEKLEKDIKEGKEVNIKETVEQSINDIIENIPENSKIKSLCQSKQQELINKITELEENLYEMKRTPLQEEQTQQAQQLVQLQKMLQSQVKQQALDVSSPGGAPMLKQSKGQSRRRKSDVMLDNTSEAKRQKPTSTDSDSPPQSQPHSPGSVKKFV